MGYLFLRAEFVASNRARRGAAWRYISLAAWSCLLVPLALGHLFFFSLFQPLLLSFSFLALLLLLLPYVSVCGQAVVIVCCLTDSIVPFPFPCLHSSDLLYLWIIYCKKARNVVILFFVFLLGSCAATRLHSVASCGFFGFFFWLSFTRLVFFFFFFLFRV